MSVLQHLWINGSFETLIKVNEGEIRTFYNGFLTSMSRQADFSRVIWSAMVRVVNPGSRLANSTILMMHLVDSSLNLSHRPRSSWTRCSALEFCSRQWQKRNTHCSLQLCLHRMQPGLATHLHFTSIREEKSIYMYHPSFRGHTDGLMGNWIS